MPSHHRPRSRLTATVHAGLRLSALTLLTAGAVTGSVTGPQQGTPSPSTVTYAADIDWP
ncbi:hypothetical protein ACWKSP_05825 [Micromonosporaceae bacterium Da 78-11]